MVPRPVRTSPRLPRGVLDVQVRSRPFGGPPHPSWTFRRTSPLVSDPWLSPSTISGPLVVPPDLSWTSGMIRRPVPDLLKGPVTRPGHPGGIPDQSRNSGRAPIRPKPSGRPPHPCRTFWAPYPDPWEGPQTCPGPPGGPLDPFWTFRRNCLPVLDPPRWSPAPPRTSWRVPQPVPDLEEGSPTSPGPLEGSPIPSMSSGRVRRTIPYLWRVPQSVPDLW